VGHEDSGPAATLVAAWFGLRAEDRGAAAVALQALRRRAAHIVAARCRCRCGIAVAEDHVADAVFVMVYAGARRASVSLPQRRSPTSVALRGTSGAGTGGAARRRPRWRSPVEVGLTSVFVTVISAATAFRSS